MESWTHEAIAVYRGWDAFERAQPDPLKIIDFDLVPEISDREEFRSRGDVLRRIERLHDELVPKQESDEFVKARLNASIHYLRALAGERVEYYQHVRNLLGITPELIERGAVAAREERVYQAMDALGIPRSGGKTDAAALVAYVDRTRIDKQEAARQAADAERRFLQLVLDLLGFKDGELDLRHTLSFANEQAYWRGWSSGKLGDFQLRYNFYPHHLWRQGDMEYLTLHEVCGHFVHAASLAREIQEARLDPFVGITMVHDPHGFQGEGIADALTYFLPDDIPLTPEAVLARELASWKDALNNNAHVLVNMGWDREALLADLLANPFTLRPKAELDLERWAVDPLLRAYQYAYGIARKYHEDWAQRMTRDQKITYLRWAFRCYATPQQLIQKAEEILGS